MNYQVLNGDALAYAFVETGIQGELIIVREALIDGSLTGDTLTDFWATRAAYHQVSMEDYQQKVVQEFNKILMANEPAEWNLWFEYDLFCQVNMWFVLSLMHSLGISRRVYAVYTTQLTPEHEQFWNGFGRATAEELRQCFAQRIELSEADMERGHRLWLAYQAADLVALEQLAREPSPGFPYLHEVVQAHRERFPLGKGRPEKVLEAITQQGITDFPAVFRAFWQRESIYGFGDSQVKKLYDNLMASA